MKIKFIQNITDNDSLIPFAVYQYDEALTNRAHYIDIKEIIKQNHLAWLDELQESHAQLSKRYSGFTRWWWATSMSRLDARPWGQEYVIKPFFFARAVIQWMESQSEVKEIALVGCDYEVIRYIKEFNKEIDIDGRKVIPSWIVTLFIAVKNSILALLKLGAEFIVLCQDHIFQKENVILSDGLVLYDLNIGDNISSGHKYFYGDLFKTLDESNQVSYACISGVKIRNKKNKKNSNTKAIYLLDHLGPWDAFLCSGINLFTIFLNWIFIFMQQPCKIKGQVSHYFWTDYLFEELNRSPSLKRICSYRALKKVLNKHTYKVIVYPYEEKGSERAILFACEGKGIKTIGYTPHPQHRLEVALRDAYPPLSPKPTMYAVCGDAYIDYFNLWGQKQDYLINVWGSGKSFKQIVDLKKVSQPRIKVLLFISHPNELKVFSSWLRSQEKMSNMADYSLRLYKALHSKELEFELKSLLNDFECVRESQKSLIEDLEACDITAFCATSAGIVAARYGCIAVHVALDDFFPINPCFDMLDDMLSCESALQFVNRLQELQDMDEDTKKQIHDRQQLFTEKIFSSAKTDAVRDDMMCSNQKNKIEEKLIS